jgi:hypothetical protein
MKKILSLILLGTTLFFTSCDPLDDTYTEVGQAPYTKDMQFTLNTANYQSLRGTSGVNAYVYNNFYFKSEVEASQFIPIYLNRNFTHLDNKSSAEVGYNLLVFPFVNNTVSTRINYTVENSDYALGGARFTNFDRFSQIETFLKVKYPTAVEGTLVNLTFTYFNGSSLPTSRTITDAFYFKNGTWYDTYLVSDTDYVSVDRDRFKNFTSADEALLPGFFDKFLKAKFTGSKVNDIAFVSYIYRISSNNQEVKAMRFNGVNWEEVTANVTIPQVLAFSKKNGTWIANLATKYTLIRADYDAIADNTAAGSAAAKANLKSFGNFNVQSAGSPTYWPEDQIILGLGELIKVKYPTAAAGDKFEITYQAFTGSVGTFKITLELQANGSFIKVI